MASHTNLIVVASGSVRARTTRSSAAVTCLTNLCIVDTISDYIDGRSLLYLSRTCTGLWNLLERWPALWKRVLPNHEDFAPFPGAHLRTARTLVILLYTSECVMCGSETSNGALGKFAVRLCSDCSAQYLAEIWTYTSWQNRPYPISELTFLPDSNMILPPLDTALQYPETSKLRDPAEFRFDIGYEQLGDPEPDAVMATGVGATTEYYSCEYLNPVYSSSAEIDRGCGFPTDLDEEDAMEFPGIQFPSNEPTDNHRSYFLPH
ncbi:unnamed protein product [Rhizoctonia solani]|uniref:F-box domain-containing protein n=1 Tax=Rhizoctonia solani TaxID=456999 RepID=A0A8H2W7X6_9AGAM|nr:unnamed protein product [Rhizoctonia solani]